MNNRKTGRGRPDVPTLVGMESTSTDTRQQAERFIWEAFHSAYGADVRHFMPCLMTLRSDSGRMVAALGIRDADDAPLYLEQYLSHPVEALLGDADGCVDRSRLVEVGNFAVGSAGGGRWLITALTAYLHAAGRTWAVFTCGPALRNAFGRLGIPLRDLGVADPACLGDTERASWGRYYQQQPHVMAADVAQSHAVLSAQFEKECALHSLWHGALRAGCVAA